MTAAALCAALALGAFARRGFAAEGLWQTDFKAAQAKAKEEKKYLLVDFTGSDWCGWCIKLHNEVFDKEPFKAEAPKQFVLVELDFPHEKEQSDDLKKQNKELSEKYNIEGFPTVLLMDAEGQVIARTGYREGGPEEYLKQLADFSKIYQNVARPEGQARQDPGAGSRQALGRDRRRLPEARQRIGRSRGLEQGNHRPGPRQQGRPEGQVRVPADPGRGHEALAGGTRPPRPRKLLDKALALKGVPGRLRQEGYMLKVQISFSEKKFVDVVATLKLAKEAAPESPMAKQIDAGIQQFSKVAEAQEAADKLEAGLAKSEGPDRAKLLDKLIEAKQKLLRFDPEAGENIQKWTKEIIALDADNKAGLKKKYQFKAALADADELMQAGQDRRSQQPRWTRPWRPPAFPATRSSRPSSSRPGWPSCSTTKNRAWRT